MKRFTAPIAALLLIFVLVGSAYAVTWGEPDNGEHPYVGTLLFVQNGDGYYSCSGTLISPTVVLTAGHCVEGEGQVNDVTYVRFDEDALSGIGDYANTQDWLDAEWILAEEVIPHPQYDDYAEFPLTYDVGLVILSEPVYLPEYGQLPDEGFLETLTKGQERRDSYFTVVGYGLQGVLKPFEMDDYARYQGEVSLIELNSTFAGGASAKFTNSPGKGNGSGGSCFGDSGGPVFYKDTTTIVAVVSWGNTPCIGVDYQFRVDTSTALDFIHDAIEE